MAYRLITLSVPTSGGGATPAATFGFMTEGYRRPRQDRTVSSDFVQNQNGKFFYRYDNGPGAFVWAPFRAVLSDDFANAVYPLGADAEEQLARLQFLWEYTGNMGMAAPEGVYEVAWAQAPFEPESNFPDQAGDKLTYYVNLTLDESG